MLPGFAEQLRRYAEVVVHVGLNLRPGQRVLIADPYTLQGVARAAAPLVEAIEVAARAAGAGAVETLWGDEELWREAAGNWPHREFGERLERNTGRLRAAVGQGEALVFLESANPRLADGLAPAAVAGLRRVCAEAYAQFSPALLAGATNWTAAPAPTSAWAEVVFADEAPEQRLARLWAAVFAACRADGDDPVAAWRDHLFALEARRDELNRRQAQQVRLLGAGTDLVVGLPAGGRWCTATLATRDGRRFVPNLPTEEVFTSPHRGRADGRLRVARPLCHGGIEMDGVELEFRGGVVVRARARVGAELLGRLLAMDAGAVRLGEVALVDQATAIARTGRVFHSALLDENALPHVALGDGYAFTVGAGSGEVLNRSLLHLDLPIDATVELG